MKVVIIGNIGSGKKAMAERLIGRENIALLPLDELSGSCEQTGHSLEEGLNMLRNVLDGHADWVVESADGDLAEVALPYCDELLFISSGAEDSADSHKYRELFDNFDGPKKEYSIAV